MTSTQENAMIEAMYAAFDRWREDHPEAELAEILAEGERIGVYVRGENG